MLDTYFDCNATTPLCKEARDAWLEASSNAWFNPASLYRGAVRTRVLLEEARAEVAAILGCSPDSIIFTSGATESNNAVFRYLKNASSGVVLLPKTEHASVRHVVEQLFPNQHEWLSVDEFGVVLLSALDERLAQGGVQAVSVMGVNNESGVIQPWEEIQALCSQHKVLFHSDMTQWVGKTPAAGVGGCDFVALSAHKFGGPKGVGLLRVPTGIEFSWVLGGGQESGRRSGTENYASVAAMLSALRVAEDNAATGLPERNACRDAFESALMGAVPGVRILCRRVSRVWNTSMLIMPKYDGLRWVEKLDAQGYAVGLGAACSSEKGAMDSVAAALGLDSCSIKRGVRVSAGWGCLRDAWMELANAFHVAWNLLESEDSGNSVVDISKL